MVRENIRSWGLPGPFQHQTIDLALQNPDWRDATTTVLPFGNGRSYGDSCINDGRCLLLARGLDRYRAFDPQTGVLVCDAGVMLSDIVRDFMRNQPAVRTEARSASTRDDQTSARAPV